MKRKDIVNQSIVINNIKNSNVLNDNEFTELRMLIEKLDFLITLCETNEELFNKYNQQNEKIAEYVLKTHMNEDKIEYLGFILSMRFIYKMIMLHKDAMLREDYDFITDKKELYETINKMVRKFRGGE